MQAQSQDYYSNQNYQYDLSDDLDLEAIATVFGESKNIEDFENKLNDYRYQVSNLDLNNDGYVDYLRVIKQYSRNTHVILIQAVIGSSYFQDVASIVIGKDYYDRDCIQIIGDSYLYGKDYIMEPVFNKRPRIVRWLWNEPQYIYISKYYWGYYPTTYRFRPIVPIQHYFNHLRIFVNVHHHYYYTSAVLNPVYVDVIHPYRRNDYWHNHLDIRFEQRNKNYSNKGQFQYYQDKKKPEVKERDFRHSEDYRRQNQTPQRDIITREPRITQPQRDTRTTVTPPSRESRPSVTPPTRVTPPVRQDKTTSPTIERSTTPSVNTKPEVKVQQQEGANSRNSNQNNNSTSRSNSDSERNSSSRTSGRR
ncbi:hypothetical protein MASR2M117_21510 [Paludibacter sp.]